jgi:hypothetical protein
MRDSNLHLFSLYVILAFSCILEAEMNERA